MFLFGSGLTIRLTIRVFIGLIKLQDQKQSRGGNRLFYLTLPGHSPSINRENQGRNSGREGTWRQELQHKPWRNAADWLAQLASSYQLGPRAQRKQWHHLPKGSTTHNGLGLQHQSLIKPMGQSGGSTFLRFSPLQFVSSLHKNNQHNRQEITKKK